MIRTHDAGALRAEHVGQTVTLAGWVANRRDHGGVAFIDLREASGVVQVVIRDEEVAHNLRSEYCLKVVGEVTPRKAGNENPNLATGEIEVVATDVEVLSAAAALPFPISDHADFPDLIEFVKQVNPKRVLTLHGFAADFAQTLRELGYDAQALSEDEQMTLGLGSTVSPSVRQSTARSTRPTRVRRKFKSRC